MTPSPPNAPPDYSWAEYLDYMEGGSDIVSLPEPRAAGVRKASVIPGFLLAAGLTVVAVIVSGLPIWSFPMDAVMLAIILGMVVGNVWTIPRTFSPGIKFSVKRILPLGIIFLGARLNFLDIVKVGAAGVLLSVLETVVALAFLLFLAKRMQLPRKLGLLLGVGTAICGGTAIVATAPVIEAEEKDVVFSVATVTLLGLVGMFLLPVLGTLMHLSEKAFGAWAGLAIHQTPQVVAAGFAYGNTAGETATIVKLARVCLLAPVVFFVGWLYRRGELQNGGSGKRVNYLHLFPMFVFGFLGMALLRTLGLLPELAFRDAALLGDGDVQVNLSRVFAVISTYCIIISMAGVGLETKFTAMRRIGAKPFVASLLAAVLIAVLTLSLIRLLGIE